MTHCIHCTRCHRPLKRPTETGMGDVCARKAKAVPVPAHERDLFGYDLGKAEQAARYRLEVHVAVLVEDAHQAVRRGFRAARERMGL